MKKESNWKYILEKEDVKVMSKDQPIWNNIFEKKKYIEKESKEEKRRPQSEILLSMCK